MRDVRILKNKRILLGLTGSVAIYKSVELARRLSKAGAYVDTILSEAATKFINPLLIESVTGRKVYTDTFQYPMAHIELAQDASLMVIAPATANIIGKFSSGIADDLLSTVFLAMSPRRVLIAPAMNWRMYENPLVQENINRLKHQGVNFVGPEAGQLCCGEEGYGRIAELEDIIDEVERLLTDSDLEGLRILVTAGPTREYLDTVRFISNKSSGKMGYALARVARRRGADVTLISGPSVLKKPYGVRFISVETTAEMRDAVKNIAENVDIIFMAGAPADFTVKKSGEKIPRDRFDEESPLNIEFIPTADIIGEIGNLPEKPFLVGFAAETSLDIEKAKTKLLKKGLNMIILNNILEPGAGFESDTNRVSIIERVKDDELSIHNTDLLPKEEIASIIIDRAIKRFRWRY